MFVSAAELVMTGPVPEIYLLTVRKPSEETGNIQLYPGNLLGGLLSISIWTLADAQIMTNIHMSKTIKLYLVFLPPPSPG